jgi:MFS family permease
VRKDAVRLSVGAVSLVFRNREMRLLQLAWAVQSISLWSFAIALGVYAFDVGGATAVGVAALVRLLPGAFASPFGGLMGDRFSRRTVLAVSAFTSAALMGAAAAAAALGAPVAVVFGLAGLTTVAICPYIPAEGALMPLVARSPQELASANVAHSVMDNAGFLGGALLSGALLAATSPEMVFAVSAGAGLASALLLAALRRDERPDYVAESTGRVLGEMATGLRVLAADSSLRLVSIALTLLVFIEGAADVLAVIVALDLLDLGQGAVGWLNAAWGIGALVGSVALAMLLQRGQLAAGIALGCLLMGAALALPGLWVVAVAGYLAYIGMGAGYTFVEVAGRTMLQRLGADETLARALGVIETSRFAAMALGSIAVPALIALFGVRGAVIALGLVLPAFALLRWSALRSLEIGAPVEEQRFQLLREHPIFAPLPLAMLERLCNDLIPITAAAGEEIVVQGETGKRFYMIAEGEVEIHIDGVCRNRTGAGDCFGEIALLNDVPRTATVIAQEDCRLLALERQHFVGAVTGHLRSDQAATSVAEDRLAVAG